MQPRQYKVFISYRHADNREEGRQWASWLHQAIETYEIPRDLVGRKNAKGEAIPERIFPVFRDEEELAADSNLTSGITQALDHSDHLVVICSPRAVGSPYVEAEIDYFKQIGKGDDIMAMIVDGEPNAEARECFPAPLRFDIDESGQRQPGTLEPIAADFRIKDLDGGEATEGWTSIEAFRQSLNAMPGLTGKQVDNHVDAYRKQHDLMKLKLISGILDVPLGELTRRDQAYQVELERKRARTLRRWLTAVAVLALLAVGGGVVAWMQRQDAVEQEQEAQRQKQEAVRQEKEAVRQRLEAEKQEKEAIRQRQEAERQEQLATQNYSLSLTQRGIEDLRDAKIEQGLARLVQSLRAWPANGVARDRLLFEVAYRPWLVQTERYAEPPAIDPAQFAEGKPAEVMESRFVTLPVVADRQLRLRQTAKIWINKERDLTVTRDLAWNGTDWVADAPVASDGWEYWHSIPLPDGRTITSLRNPEVEAGMSMIEIVSVDGQTSHLENLHGLIAMHQGASLLAIAGHNNNFPGILDIRIFKRGNLEEHSGYYELRVPVGTDIARLAWSGNQLVVSTTKSDGSRDRVHVLEISPDGEPLDITASLEGRMIPDDRWAFGKEKLFIQQDGSLVVYGIAPALIEDWRSTVNGIDDWLEFSRQPLEGGSAAREQTDLVTVGRRSQLRASVSDRGRILLTDASGKPLRTIESEHPPSLVPVDYRGVGFSADETMLGLSAIYYQAEGDVFHVWQVLAAEHGIEIYPLSTRHELAGGIVLLRYVFNALEPAGWTADDRAMVFIEAKALPYSLDDGVSGNNWLVKNGRAGDHFLLPLRWSDKPVPAWFLDAVSHLVHLKQDAGLGLESVEPLEGSFAAMVEKLLADQPPTAGDEEYRDFLRQLAKASRRAETFSP